MSVLLQWVLFGAFLVVTFNVFGIQPAILGL